MVTSVTAATWQAPTVAITTPGTTEINRLVLWGDTTGDTLASASMKMNGTTFTNTSDQNLITVGLGSGNTGVGLNTVANIITRISNVTVGDSAGVALTSGSSNTSCGINSLAALTTRSQNVGIGAAAGSSYTGAEANNICVGYNVTGTLGESNVIRIGTSSHNNLYIGNRAMYNSTLSNCSFGSVIASSGSANSGFGTVALASLTTGRNNTGVGFASLGAVTTCRFNCALGRASLPSLTTGSSNIVISYSIAQAEQINMLIIKCI
jgi:hypothetical protein